MNRTAGSILTCLACGFAASSEPEWPDYTCPRCTTINIRLYRKEHRSASVGMRLTPEEIRAEFEAARPYIIDWATTLSEPRSTPRSAAPAAKGRR